MISSVRDGILKVKGLWKEGEEEEPSFFEEKSRVRSKRSESRKCRTGISFRTVQLLKEKVDGNYEPAANGDNSADNIKAYRLGVVKRPILPLRVRQIYSLAHAYSK